MTNESVRKRDQIFAYRGRSKARATAISHPLEGRSHLFSGSDCNFADQVDADRQNRLSNKVPKRIIKRRATGLRANSRLTFREVRSYKISYASVKVYKVFNNKAKVTS